MKTALDLDGLLIEAEVGQTDKATCLHCDGVVVLRQRRRGRPRQGVTYFWRHQDHVNTRCPARFAVSSNGKKKKAKTLNQK